jgi:hypothetical protein
MSAVSEIIVREFFEQNGLLVRQPRKYIAQARGEDEDIDFFVLNPQPREREAPLPFILKPNDLPGISRAVIVVKGWHTETFSSAVMTNAPEIFRFVEPGAFKRAAEGFGDDGSLTKILVVPALPQVEESRLQSIELLRAKGIDAVILFRTILTDLITHTETNRNYQKSDLLQMIRVFKNYDLFKDPQLELFKAKRKRKTKSRAS